MKQYSLIILLVLLFACTKLPVVIHEIAGTLTPASFLKLTQIAFGLISPDRNANIEALDKLSQEYQIDVKTPALAFVDAAKTFLTALRSLKEAMANAPQSRALENPAPIVRAILDFAEDKTH